MKLKYFILRVKSQNEFHCFYKLTLIWYFNWRTCTHLVICFIKINKDKNVGSSQDNKAQQWNLPGCKIQTEHMLLIYWWPCKCFQIKNDRWGQKYLQRLSTYKWVCCWKPEELSVLYEEPFTSWELQMFFLWTLQLRPLHATFPPSGWLLVLYLFSFSRNWLPPSHVRCLITSEYSPRCLLLTKIKLYCQLNCRKRFILLSTYFTSFVLINKRQNVAP